MHETSNELAVPVEVLKAHLLVAAKDPARRIIECVAVLKTAGNDILLVSTDSYSMLVTSHNLSTKAAIDSCSGWNTGQHLTQCGILHREHIEQAIKLHTAMKFPKGNPDFLPVLTWDADANSISIIVGFGNSRNVIGGVEHGEFPRISQLVPPTHRLSTGGGNYPFHPHKMERIGKIGNLLDKDMPMHLLGSMDGDTHKPVLFGFSNDTAKGFVLQMTQRGDLDVQSINVVAGAVQHEQTADELRDLLNQITNGDYSNAPVGEFKAKWLPTVNA